MTSAELKYLMSISDLYDGTNGIKLTAIASHVGVSKVSVFRALERLEKSGYITRDEKNRVVMTEYGFAQLAEYKLMIRWLGCHLEHHCGVPGETALQDAIGATCAMSDKSRHGLAAFIKSGKKER